MYGFSETLTPQIILQNSIKSHTFATGITTYLINFMKQASHFYNLESKENKSGERLIFFNLSYGFMKYNPKTNTATYQPMRLSTRYAIHPKFWDKEVERANKSYLTSSGGGKDLNDTLDKIEKAAYDQLALYRNEFDIDPTPEELKELVSVKLKRVQKKSKDIRIADFIDLEIKRRKSIPVGSKEYWDSKTQTQYTNLRTAIVKYETKLNTTLAFGSITEDAYWDFFKVINEIYKEETGKYYIKTSIAKACKNLRAIFNAANEQNIPINLNYSKRGLKIHPSKAKYKTYLTQDQLTEIINKDVAHSVEFTTAKNYILVSSFTGLRIGDMKFLHTVKPEKRNINGKSYDCFFTKVRKSSENKEELIVGIPMLKPVRKVLGENNGSFPKFPSEPNIRKYCKKFLEFMEFNAEVKVTYDYYLSEPEHKLKRQHELFSPHDCRSTFITNLQKMEIQNATIEPITHPKISYATILDLYNKSNLEDNILKLINAVNSKKSSIYKY